MIHNQTWLPHEILVSDWPIKKTSSPRKPLGQMNRNLAGNIYGMSFMTIAHFVPIGSKHGYHRNLVGIIYGMSSIKIALISSRSVIKHGCHRNLVGSIYGMSSMKIAHFVPISQQTWPPHAILVSDWSISKEFSLLKLLSHMNRNLVGSIHMYGRFCIKFPQSRMKGERHRHSPLSLQF